MASSRTKFNIFEPQQEIGILILNMSKTFQQYFLIFKVGPVNFFMFSIGSLLFYRFLAYVSILSMFLYIVLCYIFCMFLALPIEWPWPPFWAPHSYPPLRGLLVKIILPLGAPAWTDALPRRPRAPRCRRCLRSLERGEARLR